MRSRKGYTHRRVSSSVSDDTMALILTLYAYRITESPTIFRVDRFSVLSAVDRTGYYPISRNRNRWDICEKSTRYALSTLPITAVFYLFYFIYVVLVIKTFEKEMIGNGINALKPLDRADDKSGVADPDEVTKVVVNRSGSILSASTIIKSDFFSNLQKMTLPE